MFKKKDFKKKKYDHGEIIQMPVDHDPFKNPVYHDPFKNDDFVGTNKDITTKVLNTDDLLKKSMNAAELKDEDFEEYMEKGWSSAKFRDLVAVEENKDDAFDLVANVCRKHYDTAVGNWVIKNPDGSRGIALNASPASNLMIGIPVSEKGLDPEHMSCIVFTENGGYRHVGMDEDGAYTDIAPLGGPVLMTNGSPNSPTYLNTPMNLNAIDESIKFLTKAKIGMYADISNGYVDEGPHDDEDYSHCGDMCPYYRREK